MFVCVQWPNFTFFRHGLFSINPPPHSWFFVFSRFWWLVFLVVTWPIFFLFLISIFVTAKGCNKFVSIILLSNLLLVWFNWYKLTQLFCHLCWIFFPLVGIDHGFLFCFFSTCKTFIQKLNYLLCCCWKMLLSFMFNPVIYWNLLEYLDFDDQFSM